MIKVVESKYKITFIGVKKINQNKKNLKFNSFKIIILFSLQSKNGLNEKMPPPKCNTLNIYNVS